MPADMRETMNEAKGRNGGVASLRAVGVRRAPYGGEPKDGSACHASDGSGGKAGDITAMLAAMPVEPEILLPRDDAFSAAGTRTVHSDPVTDEGPADQPSDHRAPSGGEPDGGESVGAEKDAGADARGTRFYTRLDPEAGFGTRHGAAMRDVTPRSPKRDIAGYWDDLRRGRRMPRRDDLKASEVAARSPGAVLLRGGDRPGQLQPDAAFATALRAHGRGGRIAGGVETTAMLSQWMLSVARKVLDAGAPMREASHFDTSDGRVQYTLIALPFGSDAERVDHVLCQLGIT